MKRNLFLTVVVFIFLLQINAQNSQLDTWSIGFGANNTVLHGDLTSVYSQTDDRFNVGFYLYVDKMITPAFGFELKGQMVKLRGSTQDFAPGFPNRLFAEGEAFGGEINAIINLNGLSQNPYARANRKLNFSTYLGLGYHTYNSKLFDLDTDELLIDFESVDGRGGNAKSIYYTAGLGIKYRLSSKFDIEVRQTANFNNEDHLDAAVSQKQVFETFFTTNLGLVYKLNKKDSDNIIWQDVEIVEKTEEVAIVEPIKLNDTDGDGVLDQFDKEPNTPEGALTYGNGVAIDTDRDGIIDLNDKCPLKFGTKDLDGCPVEKDTDGDGLSDKDDLCPNAAGPIDNQGCPIIKNTITEVEKTTILNLAKNIYFTSGDSVLRDSAKRELDKIGDIMTRYPDINFVVEGHTDSGGKRAYNLKLSQDRANSVKAYLVRIGINSFNLNAIGYGFSIPKYNNRTSGGRQLNRRVEIKIDESSSADTKVINTTNVINNTFTEVRHTIIKEDTLFSISKKYNVTVDQLKEWNNLVNNNIIIGNTIIIRQ